MSSPLLLDYGDTWIMIGVINMVVRGPILEVLSTRDPFPTIDEADDACGEVACDRVTLHRVHWCPHHGTQFSDTYVDCRSCRKPIEAWALDSYDLHHLGAVVSMASFQWTSGVSSTRK